MNKSRAALTGIAVAIAALGATYGRMRLYPHDASGTMRVSGNIEITTTEASFKIPGRVVERLVTEGDVVTKGQVIARLDSLDLEAQLAQRRAEADLARASLAELQAGSRPEEIAEARAALDRAQSDAQRARQEYERIGSLLGRKLAVSQQEFDTADANVRSAEATVREAQGRLSRLERGPRREQVDQAAARWQQAKHAVELAEAQLGYATMTAPLSGLVLSKNIEAGEYVAPGTPVVTIGDLEHPWLRAYVSETDLGRVAVGQAVQVRTDTFPDKVYPGRISFIASQSEFTPKNVQTNKERVKLVYRIKVELANPAMELKAGMPADGDIVLGDAS